MKLKYKVMKVQKDTSPGLDNRSLVSIEFNDDTGDKPYILGFSIQNPAKPMSAEELIEIIKSKYDILRPDRYLYPLKESIKEGEEFETEVETHKKPAKEFFDNK